MAVTAVAAGTNPAYGIVYAYVTDSSVDWTGVTNDSYFYDKASDLAYYKNSGGTIVNIFEEGGTDRDPRVGTTTSTSSLTIDTSTTDMYTVTALAAAMTINAPTGSPVQGRKLTIRIKDNGTARALTWNAIFRAIGVTLPTTTTISKTLYVGFIYNSTDTKWDCVAVNEEA